jgi:hypothetical protein
MALGERVLVTRCWKLAAPGLCIRGRSGSGDQTQLVTVLPGHQPGDLAYVAVSYRICTVSGPQLGGSRELSE